MTDSVNKPEHYAYGKYECIDVIHELTKDLAGIQAFCLGNTIKYLWRFQHKNGVEDLKKAKWYLERLIKEFEEPKTDKDFNESNYVYQEQSEYLGDATNPNKCVATNKSNPNNTPRPIYQLDDEMNVIKKYDSIHSAIRDHMNGGIGYAVRHGTRSNGYYWKYAD